MAPRKLASWGVACSLTLVVGCVGTVLDADDDGSVATLAEGRQLTLRLGSNPSTGYEWQLVELDTAIVENTGHEYVQGAALVEIVGAGGTEVWTFVARSAGTTALRLEYRQPWGPDEVPASDSFGVTIVVTPER